MSGLLARIHALGLTLQPTTPPVGNYLPAVVEGSLVFCAGATCMKDGGPIYRGKVGRDLTVEQGAEAARLAALNAIQKMIDVVGDPDRIRGIVKLVGHINCGADFTEHARVMNGASDFLTAVFGDEGRHARLSLGASSLPGDVPLEVEIVARLHTSPPG